MTENENGNRYALHALKDKRATLAGEIADLKKQLAWRVQQLDHVDACLTIFEPTGDPAAIPVLSQVTTHLGHSMALRTLSPRSADAA
jgi:hypothetical protein